MTVETLPPPVWVDDQINLKRMAEHLSMQTRVAVDTESNSLHAYRERVCLIQFSTPKRDYVVDPLALEDLSLLAHLFSSAKVEKIFHAAEYDLICLKRDFGFEFNNLFDTMQAARILGYQYVGLDSILAKSSMSRWINATKKRTGLQGHCPVHNWITPVWTRII
jgi:ribonuclease D